MKQTIIKMIDRAYENRDFEFAGEIAELLSEFAYTINCPSNWRDLGEELAEMYRENDWVTENCKLYDFIES